MLQQYVAGDNRAHFEEKVRPHISKVLLVISFISSFYACKFGLLICLLVNLVYDVEKIYCFYCWIISSLTFFGGKLLGMEETVVSVDAIVIMSFYLFELLG